MIGDAVDAWVAWWQWWMLVGGPIAVLILCVGLVVLVAYTGLRAAWVIGRETLELGPDADADALERRPGCGRIIAVATNVDFLDGMHPDEGATLICQPGVLCQDCANAAAGITPARVVGEKEPVDLAPPVRRVDRSSGRPTCGACRCPLGSYPPTDSVCPSCRAPLFDGPLIDVREYARAPLKVVRRETP